MLHNKKSDVWKKQLSVASPRITSIDYLDFLEVIFETLPCANFL